MTNWIVTHFATVLIFLGGTIVTVGAFVVERKTETKTSERRKGAWPNIILAGTLIGIAGSVWTGYAQDRLSEYLTGGDGYGYVVAIPGTTKSIEYMLVHSGDLPLYDVLVSVRDHTLERKLMLEKGLEPGRAYSWDASRPPSQVDDIMARQSRIESHFTLGNIGPESTNIISNGPVPPVDDQRYDVTIWSRNTFITEVILLHRTSTGWASAMKVWRTDRYSKDGNPAKTPLEEHVDKDFPSNLVDWK